MLHSLNIPSLQQRLTPTAAGTYCPWRASSRSRLENTLNTEETQKIGNDAVQLAVDAESPSHGLPTLDNSREPLPRL